MALLQPNEYDASYFDGASQTMKHNAGYDHYKRWYRVNGPDSLGEYWRDQAKKIFDQFNLNGKKVLEIGCAKGFVVNDLRDFGVDAYGLDVSKYAIDNCEPEVAQYLTIGDARAELTKYQNSEFDFLFSLRFLECIPENDLPSLIAEMNRVSKKQFHSVDDFSADEDLRAAQYYLRKNIEQWSSLGFRPGTEMSLVGREQKIVKIRR